MWPTNTLQWNNSRTDAVFMQNYSDDLCWITKCQFSFEHIQRFETTMSSNCILIHYICAIAFEIVCFIWSCWVNAIFQILNFKQYFLTQIYHFNAIFQMFTLFLSFGLYFYFSFFFTPHASNELVLTPSAEQPTHTHIYTYRNICKRTDSNHSHEFAMFLWNVRQRRQYERFNIQCLWLWAVAVAFYNRALHLVYCYPFYTVASVR